MAEPTNTPMPTAPPTRSSSPAPPLPTFPPPPSILSMSPMLATEARRRYIESSAPFTGMYWHERADRSHCTDSVLASGCKPTILQLGDPVKSFTEAFGELSSQYHMVRLSPEERTRPALITGLGAKKWGDFTAVLRTTDREMVNWDAELIALLPNSVRLFVNTGPKEEDSVDRKALREKEILYCDASSTRIKARSAADTAEMQILFAFGVRPTTSSLHTGVLGFVGISDITYHILACFALYGGQQILFYDTHGQRTFPWPRMRAMASLEELVRTADIVVLGDMAGRRFDRECLKWMKADARLVSLRSNLVDEDAVAEALQGKTLAGAALSVTKPLVRESLMKFVGSKLLLTTHQYKPEDMAAWGEQRCLRWLLMVLESEAAGQKGLFASLSKVDDFEM